MTENPPSYSEPFHLTLSRQNLSLNRAELNTLQVNTGLLCNLACKHCHLEAGPTRKELLNAETAEQLIHFAEKFSFETIDITGGAPELNPNITDLIEGLAPLTPRLMMRSNLTALEAENRHDLIKVCKNNNVVIVASFPAINQAQAEAQRGNNYFLTSLDILKKLNSHGYGKMGSELELNLASNPTGAFMPGPQKSIEDRFRQVLLSKWDVEFSNLFSFANVPLGRFKKWLISSGNFENYMHKLASAFNPDSLNCVMCRSLLSVNWDGYLFDCDFNLALDLPMGGSRQHFTEIHSLPEPGAPIAVSDHCYACTAGSGFT